MLADWRPGDALPDATCEIVDDLAQLAGSDDLAAIRERYDRDDGVRVPADITTVVHGEVVPVRLAL